jgi:hypothetical protein
VSPGLPGRSPGEAGSLEERFATLRELVDSPGDLFLDQWLRLYERALAAEPDLMIEVGRGYGNSTVVLTDAAHALHARVISVGDDMVYGWAKRTRPRLSTVVDDDWFEPLTVVQGDVRDFTPPSCDHPFVFWDAHGPEVAEAMFDRVLPALPTGATSVVIHDISTPEEADAHPLEIGYPYAWRHLVSPFDELPVVGRWLDEQGITPEQDTGMLAFTV